MAKSALKHVEDHGATAPEPVAPQSIFEHAPGDSPAAALQNMIYRRFAEMDALAPPPTYDFKAETRAEVTIQFVSRWGGVALFVAAMTGVLVAIF